MCGLAVCKALNIPNNGYSPVNNLIIDISGMFYACLGLFLLIHLLSQYFPLKYAVASGLLIFIGTNTLYYASVQTGMSHIYSFFLVILSLHFIHKLIQTENFKWFVGFCFSFSLIVLIRPINIIYVFPLFLFIVSGIQELKKRINQFLNFKHIATALLVGFLVFLPQFIYWKFAYGKFISDSYPGETFAYLSSPKIKEFLFSPHNGLISYSPLYLLLILLTALMIKTKPFMYGAVLMCAGLLIYLSASWYLFFFGCGFSARNFVELSGLFAFPIAEFLHQNSRLFKKIIFVFLAAVCLIINIKLMVSWDVCFWGSNDWDWREYKYLLYQKPKSIVQNPDSLNPEKITLLNSEKVYKLDSLELYSPGINFYPNQLTSGYLKDAMVSLDIMPLSPTHNAQLACMGFYNDSSLFYNAVKIDGKQKEWKTVNLKTRLPFHATKNYLIKIFVMNANKEEYYMKNLRVDLN